MNHLESHFQKFHQENPHIYQYFKRFAFEVISHGFDHYSARAIIHRIRWHLAVNTKEIMPNPDDPTRNLKICNNHTPYYSRMFMEDFPQHVGFFRTRETLGEIEEDGDDPQDAFTLE